MAHWRRSVRDMRDRAIAAELKRMRGALDDQGSRVHEAGLDAASKAHEHAELVRAHERLAERCATAERERAESRTALLASSARVQELEAEMRQLAEGSRSLEEGARRARADHANARGAPRRGLVDAKHARGPGSQRARAQRATRDTLVDGHVAHVVLARVGVVRRHVEGDHGARRSTHPIARAAALAALLHRVAQRSRRRAPQAHHRAAHRRAASQSARRAHVELVARVQPSVPARARRHGTHHRAAAQPDRAAHANSWLEYNHEARRARIVVERISARMRNRLAARSWNTWYEHHEEMRRVREIVRRIFLRMTRFNTAGYWLRWKHAAAVSDFPFPSPPSPTSFDALRVRATRLPVLAPGVRPRRR